MTKTSRRKRKQKQHDEFASDTPALQYTQEDLVVANNHLIRALDRMDDLGLARFAHQRGVKAVFTDTHLNRRATIQAIVYQAIREAGHSAWLDRYLAKQEQNDE